MRTILVGNCADDRLYRILDPDAPTESQFELAVARTLSCVYRDYRCIVFGGNFRYYDRCSKPDLALIANDFSHWFIIEVELVSHSFEGHVLPQVKAFRYGDPEPDCVTILSRQLAISDEQARTLLSHVPRCVAVVANKQDKDWEIALNALDIQFLKVSMFRSGMGVEAFEVEGTLEVLEESLGFGRYSATDRSLHFPKTVKLPTGTVQINESGGSISSWTVTSNEKVTWVTKDVGVPSIPDGCLVQLIRAFGGRLSFRRPD